MGSADWAMYVHSLSIQLLNTDPRCAFLKHLSGFLLFNPYVNQGSTFSAAP